MLLVLLDHTVPHADAWKNEAAVDDLRSGLDRELLLGHRVLARYQLNVGAALPFAQPRFLP